MITNMTVYWFIGFSIAVGAIFILQDKILNFIETRRERNSNVAKFNISSGGKVIAGDMVGRNITMLGNRVFVDHNEIHINSDSIIDGIVEIRIVEGTIDNLETDANVVCGSVGGSVEAGGNVSCSNVEGSIDAAGNVVCGKVEGYVEAGGNVSAMSVHGGIEAGGNVRINS